MATITSAGSGLWSAGATWVGGVAPADNDAVVIATGHVVEFDVDQSGFANGIDGITITGTLSLTRTTGAYHMKIKAAKTIGGAGTFDCGTSGSIIPFAAKHTITGGAGWYIKGNDGAGLTMTVYAAEPSIKTVLLTAGESAGATVLRVDTSVIGDLWADGDTIRIDNVNKGANSEERVIAAGGIAAGTITITAGLTAAKIAGTVVSLITRNVRFIGVNGAITSIFSAGKLLIAGGQFGVNYNNLLYGGYASISGGTFSGANSMLNSLVSASISEGVFSGNTSVAYNAIVTIAGGHYSGNSSVFAGACRGSLVSGGEFKGCGYIVSGTNNVAITGGTYYGIGDPIANSYAILLDSITLTFGWQAINNSQVIAKNCTFNGGFNYDASSSIVTMVNCLLGDSVEVAGYSSLSKYSYSESIDHDQVAGAYKAWTKGGVTSSQASVLPTGYTTAMQTVLENAAAEGYWQKEYTVGAGASIQFTMNLRKAASMTYLPRCIIFNKASADPFAGGAGLHTFTMTDSIDTWEAESWTYTNSTAADVTLVVRFQGMHATATFYSALLAEQINVDLTTALAQIAAVKAKTDNLPADPADQSAVEAAITGSIVEGTITYQQALRLMLAVLAGKASGGGTTTVKFRDTGDTKDRVTATTDTNGNRSAVVLDGA